MVVEESCFYHEGFIGGSVDFDGILLLPTQTHALKSGAKCHMPLLRSGDITTAGDIATVTLLEYHMPLLDARNTGDQQPTTSLKLKRADQETNCSSGRH